MAHIFYRYSRNNDLLVRHIDVLHVLLLKLSGDPRLLVVLPDHFHGVISAIPLYHRWMLLGAYPADWAGLAHETNVEEA